MLQDFKDTIEKYKELDIEKQIDYDKFYLYSIITHSTAIEGSTITEIENQLLFDEGISSRGKSITEQMMNLDLKKAYERAGEIARNGVSISVDLIKELSSIVMKNTGSEYNTPLGTFNSANGDLRLVNVRAGATGSSYMNFQKVPYYLDLFCKKVNEGVERVNITNDLIEKYKLSFEAHYDFVTIHPFVDGNGRMGRLIMNMVQMKMGIPLSKITKESKLKYIKALEDSRNEESTQPILEFMFEEHLNNLKEEIRLYEKSIDFELYKKEQPKRVRKIKRGL